MNIDYSDESTLTMNDDHINYLKDYCEKLRGVPERESPHEFHPHQMRMGKAPTLNCDKIIDWGIFLTFSLSFLLTLILYGICLQAFFELEGSGLIACGVCAVLSAVVCGVAGWVAVKRG